jgi:ATP-binding cassette, subfamily F, member 3
MRDLTTKRGLNMLTVHQLSKAYGLAPILNNISFSVNPGDRVGLIGPNGCGKTTLLRILAGRETADNGHIALTPANLRLGYLAQGFEPEPELTVTAVINQITGDPDQLEKQVSALAVALAQSPQDDALQAAYDRALARLSQPPAANAPAILAALGLADIPADQPCGHLSGGQKTRLALATILLDAPQLLLLDEPTNHLDIEMLEWLEDWLAAFPGAALIVSHDRAFLDQTVNGVLDLDPKTQTIREYVGNYSDYMEQFLAEREKQEAAYRDQVYEIKRMKQDIARTKSQAAETERRVKSVRLGGIKEGKDHYLRLAKKVAKKSKSREKKLERYINSDERVEKPGQGWQMKLDFAQPARLGRQALSLEDLSIGYQPDLPLASDITAYIQAGERIALVGANGSGKTTLLRAITGQLRPLAGYIRLGSSVRLGYMSQEQELLDLQATPLSTIQAAAPLNQTEARSFLHYFLFSGDDPLRPVGELSFGERARLTLALLVAQGCNLLLLDEPLNHLDIPSRARFEQALAGFSGAVLAVVHDRYFIDQFADKLWLMQDGTLTEEIL